MVIIISMHSSFFTSSEAAVENVRTVRNLEKVVLALADRKRRQSCISKHLKYGYRIAMYKFFNKKSCELLIVV